MGTDDREAIGWRPGAAWSVWDMLEFQGKSFVMALEGLYACEKISTTDPKWLLGPNSVADYWADLLKGQLDLLGCTQTAKKVRFMKISLENGRRMQEQGAAGPDAIINAFKDHLKETINRLQDELEDQKLYCITARDAEALRPVGQVYGQEVETAFNGSLFDLEEASKSIAFGRGTAGVFHLMRAMETAVQLAGVTLGATVVDKDDRDLEWGKIIANMKAPIEAKDKGDDKTAWSEVLSLLYHVKEAWRNTTMHPKQTYTLEEANDVLAAVRSFLRRLAPLV